MKTHQSSVWRSEFGLHYTQRSPQTIEQFDDLYTRQFGLTRSQLNERFLGTLGRSLSILEVGTNIGAQLDGLRAMGFNDLTGMDLDHTMLCRAKSGVPCARFTQADVLQLPFADNAFDLVFTSGVLIHIAEENLANAMDSLHRCARQYVWGCEYFAESRTEIDYRGQHNFIWKDNFAARFAQRHPDAQLLREERIPYLQGDNVDSMYLFKKVSS